MTDRELLELAAKAAGYDISHRWNAERLLLNPPVDALCIDGVSTGWNPLKNDGDALCLAVGLGIEIYPDREVNEVQTAYCVGRIGYNTREEVGAHGGDWMKATRRAIVRAAAEIGKGMV